MKKKGGILLLGLIVILAGWWVLNGSSLAQPSEGVIDVWVTWGDEPDQLQALFDRYGPSDDIPIRVTTKVRDDDLLEALADPEPPDLVILSAGDPVASYHEQGLVEPLDGWMEAGGIDLGDVLPAALARCQGPGGAILCLPWGNDVDALFWNKDLFKAAGLDPERPPQTMEELFEVAGKLIRRDEEGDLSQVGLIPAFPHSHTELYVHLLGGSLHEEGGAELALVSEPVVEALRWQAQFNSIYDPEELQDFVSSFTPYMASQHPTFAGRRMSCQQCHRSTPLQNAKIPDTGFFEGKIAMMIDGPWQVNREGRSNDESPLNYGVVPVPPPAAHPERANTTVVRGPVVIIPAGAVDKEAAVHLLKWMTSPEIGAEAADTYRFLPASRTALQDARFRQNPSIQVLAELLAQPNAEAAISTPISAELNEALARIEAEVLEAGGDPALLLNEIQTELGVRLEGMRTDGTKP
jgi:ABC-type glycerol-3-phosphate transport system substrate-binding protein